MKRSLPIGERFTATLSARVPANLPQPPARCQGERTRQAAALLLDHRGYPDLRLAYDFYLGRPGVEPKSIDRVRRVLASPEAGPLLITSRRRWQELSAEAPPSWRALASRTLDGREVVVVGSRPPSSAA